MTYSTKPPVVLTVITILMLISSCIVVDDDRSAPFPCLDGEGPAETTRFELPPITGVEVRSDIEVILSQGPVQEVEARAPANLLDELILEVDGGDLEIRTRRCISAGSRPQLFITLPQLNRVVNSSTADVFSDNTFVTNNTEITITGSGDVDLGLLSETVKANLSGSGNLLLEGEAATLNVKITGSGDYRGFGMAALSAAVSTSGSGDAEVFALDFLEAAISGSGDVFYKGDPFLEVRQTGSGKLIDAN